MSSGPMPKLSVITPSYNQASFIEQTIKSVLHQNYPNLEYLIMDGGSTDSTLEIIKKYEASITHWESEPDRGQADAINKGLKRAKGEFVAWINSDDFYLPGALIEASENLISHPEVGMVYADGILVGREGKLLDWHHYNKYSALDLMQFKVILQPTVVMRRDALEEADYLSEQFHLVLDHDLWIRIASRYPILHVDSFWAAERTYPEAKTRAMAAGFVQEAETLINKAATEEPMRSIYVPHRRTIQSALSVFAGRRLIDGGEYGKALAAFFRATFIHPGPVLRYWYKVIQALIGFLGLEQLFLRYRQMRRQIQHRGLVVTINGVESDSTVYSGAE